MNQGKLVFAQLTQHLPLSTLRRCVARCRGELKTGATAGMFAAIADRQIGKALERIHEAPAEPWTLANLAQRAGMSRSAFAARFSQLVGQTAMQYLAFWRMQKAREFLDQMPLSAGTVAERVGYQSEAAFARAFKTVVGVGPGAYRKRPRTSKAE